MTAGGLTSLPMAAVGGSPAQVRPGAVLVNSLSLAVLSFGMLTTLIRAFKA